MAEARFQPVRRSRRELPRKRVTAFEVVWLALAAFGFCASALRQQTQESVHVAPGQGGQGSLLGPLLLAALVAAPALISLGVRALLRQMKRRSHPGTPLQVSRRPD